MLIFEDDAVIKDDFFNRLYPLLALMREQRYAGSEWLDLKLYSQPRLQGFAWDAQPLLELLAYSALCGWLFEVLLSTSWSWWRSSRYNRMLIKGFSPSP